MASIAAGGHAKAVQRLSSREVTDSHPVNRTQTSAPVDRTKLFSARRTESHYHSLCKFEEFAKNPTVQSKVEQGFNVVMSVVVFLSVFALAAEVDFGPDTVAGEEQDSSWLIVESIFLITFSAEIVIRLVWKGPREWCKSLWNWLDLFIVTVGIVQSWFMSFVGEADRDMALFNLLRVLRLVRLVRLVKLMRAFRGLYIVLMSWLSSLTSVMYVAIMMAMGIFFFAVVATQIIGKSYHLREIPLGNGGRKVGDIFGNIPQSMYTLFQIMTLDGFEETTRPIVMERPEMFIFFGCFIMVFSFGMLNMLVGLVVERTLSEAQRLAEEDQKESNIEVGERVSKLRTVFEACPQDEEGCVKREHFIATMSTQVHVKEVLDEVGIPVESVHDVFNIMDTDGDGHVTMSEFIVGCENLRKSRHVWAIAGHAAVRALSSSVDSIRAGQDKLHVAMKQLAEEQAFLLSDLGHNIHLRYPDHGTKNEENSAFGASVEDKDKSDSSPNRFAEGLASPSRRIGGEPKQQEKRVSPSVSPRDVDLMGLDISDGEFGSHTLHLGVLPHHAPSTEIRALKLMEERLDDFLRRCEANWEEAIDRTIQSVVDQHHEGGKSGRAMIHEHAKYFGRMDTLLSDTRQALHDLCVAVHMHKSPIVPPMRTPWGPGGALSAIPSMSEPPQSARRPDSPHSARHSSGVAAMYDTPLSGRQSSGRDSEHIDGAAAVDELDTNRAVRPRRNSGAELLKQALDHQRSSSPFDISV